MVLSFLLLEQHMNGAGGVVRLATQGQLPDGGLVGAEVGSLTTEAELGAGDRNGSGSLKTKPKLL